MVDVPCFVGVDVAKAQLDIAVRPSGERWAVPNDAGGVVMLVERLQALHPTLIARAPPGSRPRRRRWMPARWRIVPNFGFRQQVSFGVRLPDKQRNKLRSILHVHTASLAGRHKGEDHGRTTWVGGDSWRGLECA